MRVDTTQERFFYRLNVLYKPMCWRTLLSQNSSHSYYVKVLSLLRVFAHLVIMSVPHTYREACIMHGLLEDDSEWRLCLQEAGDMASGYQLCNLFVIILCDCSSSNPLALWMQFCDKICDDLRYVCIAASQPPRGFNSRKSV